MVVVVCVLLLHTEKKNKKGMISILYHDNAFVGEGVFGAADLCSVGQTRGGKV